MALPAKIDAANNLEMPLYPIQPGLLCCYGTRLFFVGCYPRGGGDTIEVWSSGDGGETWVEDDGENHIVGDNPVSVCQDGGTLHIFHCQPGNEGKIAQFDLSTRTWGTVTTGHIHPGDSYYSYPNQVGFILRSDGSYMAILQIDDEYIDGVPYARIGWSAYSGGSWSAPITMNAGTMEFQGIIGAVKGVDDRIHVLVSTVEVIDGMPTGDNQLKHQSVSSANVISALELVTDTCQYDGDRHDRIYATPLSWFQSATLKMAIPFIQATDQLGIAFASCGPSPSWIVETVDTIHPPDYLSFGAALTLADGILQIYWNGLDVPSGYSNIYSVKRTGGVWDSPILMRSPVWGNPDRLIPGNIPSNGIGMVYGKGESGTGLYYYAVAGAIAASRYRGR
jgi:hypothetical protein